MSATRDDMAAFFDIHGFQRGISRDGCNSLTQNFSAFLYNDLIDASGQPRPLADIADDALHREIHTADAKAAFQTPYRPAMLDATVSRRQTRTSYRSPGSSTVTLPFFTCYIRRTPRIYTRIYAVYTARRIYAYIRQVRPWSRTPRVPLTLRPSL